MQTKVTTRTLKLYNVFWAPEGRVIAQVEAFNPRKAIRKAPKPYRRYLGEMYAEEVIPQASVEPIN